MPLAISDISNPDVIKFLIESYDKTTRLRMKWNRIYGARVKEAATLQREEKGYFETNVLKAAMAEGMPAITREHINAGRYRRRKPIRDAIFIPGIAHLRKGHSISEVGLGDVAEDPRLASIKENVPLMRPMDPEQQAILYKEIPNYGRRVYLNSREKIQPEKRYYMRETEGWEYGWRLKDSYFSKKQTTHGRVRRLTRDVISRTGPHPDPDYYKNADKPGPSKCFAN